MDDQVLRKLGIEITPSNAVPDGTIIAFANPLLTDEDRPDATTQEALIRWLVERRRIVMLTGFSMGE